MVQGWRSGLARWGVGRNHLKKMSLKPNKRESFKVFFGPGCRWPKPLALANGIANSSGASDVASSLARTKATLGAPAWSEDLGLVIGKGRNPSSLPDCRKRATKGSENRCADGGRDGSYRPPYRNDRPEYGPPLIRPAVAQDDHAAVAALTPRACGCGKAFMKDAAASFLGRIPPERGGKPNQGSNSRR